MIQAQIITIGDEILIGQVVDTNSAWLAQLLNREGIQISRIWSIADTYEAIHGALDSVPKEVNLVIMTGGLGPTKDDITKDALTKWFDSGWKMDEDVLNRVKQHFAERGVRMPDVNVNQARIPEVCEALHNEYGTAPGMWFEKNKTIFISMPGVPYEMKYIFEHQALPKIRTHFEQREILHRTVMTQGIGESSLMELISDWEESLKKEKIKLAYLPSPGIVRLRLSMFDYNPLFGKEILNRKIEELLPLIEEYVFGFDDEKLEMVLGRLLKQGRQTIASAESCTGGYIAHLITSVSGSSAYYMGSAITYSNQAKIDVLGVDASDITKHGAVSEQVALQMAEGVKDLYKTDFAISTTGVAGPDGGSDEKPVGTVWIGIATPNGTFAQKFLMGNHRERNIRRTALQALQMVRKEIIQEQKISISQSLVIEN